MWFQPITAPTLSVSLRGNVLVIRTFNFAVYSTDLGEGQRRSLEALGIVLLDELDYLNYGSVTVAGHAHPTGITGEQDTLVNISLVRAETVADLLSQRGVSVGIVQGMGGNWLLNDGSTEAGRGLNRRVEIAMEVAP